MSTMTTTTKEEIMQDPAVHTLTKEVLRLSEGKDIIDRYYDVKLALDILKAEMYEALGQGTR